MTEREMIPVLERVVEAAEALPALVRGGGDDRPRRHYIEGAREYFDVGEWLLSYEELMYLAEAWPAFEADHKDDLDALDTYFVAAKARAFPSEH